MCEKRDTQRHEHKPVETLAAFIPRQANSAYLWTFNLFLFFPGKSDNSKSPAED